MAGVQGQGHRPLICASSGAAGHTDTPDSVELIAADADVRRVSWQAGWKHGLSSCAMSLGVSVSAQQVGVTYTLSAFKRARFVGGGNHLLLRAEQPNDVARVALAEATFAVTEALEDYEARDEAYVVLGTSVSTPNGPMAFVRDCEPAKALPLMLDRLASELAARGITGTLTPVKEARETPLAHFAKHALGMILSPLNDTDAMYAAFEDWRHQQQLRGSWVEEERHRRVLTVLLEWLTQVKGKAVVLSTTSFEVDRNGLVDYVIETLPNHPRVTISVTGADGRIRRRVRFADSQILLFEHDVDQPRRDQLAAFTDLAVRLAPDLAYALVRELADFATELPSLRKVPPTIALFQDLSFTGPVKHLEPHYVYDAGAAQVLTTSQLTKTTLPAERWHVEALGNDRHLVTAVDPNPWLHPDPHYLHEGNKLPPDWTDPEVLAAARADFGPAILTLDTLRQHPPPLTADQIRTDPNLRNRGVLPPNQ